jgi:type II secretory pathway component PulM
VNELWRRLGTGFQNLAPRERLLVTVAGGLLALAVLYLGVVVPLLSLGSRAGQQVATAERELTILNQLRQQFDEVNGRLGSVEGQIQAGPRGNIRTTLESLARQANVKVESMEPQASPANDRYRENKVEVSLQDVTLAQTVSYLHKIEAANQVLSVKSLRVRTRPSSAAANPAQSLDVTFTVSSFEPL